MEQVLQQLSEFNKRGERILKRWYELKEELSSAIDSAEIEKIKKEIECVNRQDYLDMMRELTEISAISFEAYCPITRMIGYRNNCLKRQNGEMCPNFRACYD